MPVSAETMTILRVPLSNGTATVRASFWCEWRNPSVPRTGDWVGLALPSRLVPQRHHSPYYDILAQVQHVMAYRLANCTVDVAACKTQYLDALTAEALPELVEDLGKAGWYLEDTNLAGFTTVPRHAADVILPQWQPPEALPPQKPWSWGRMLCQAFGRKTT